MKIISICSNYGSIKDGIGHYTENVVDYINSEFINIDIKVYSGKTYDLSKFRLATSTRMSFNLLKLVKDIIRGDVDIILIEYPFHEWNPLFLMAVYIVKLLSIIYNKKIVLSLHEYKRTSFLRRFFIKRLIKVSDDILATNPKEIEKFVRKKSRLFKRRIPSNIKTKIKSLNKTVNRFCFFGLISSSKAYYEMIEGWKLFNENNNYELHICTSSEILNADQLKKFGIIIHRNYPDELVSQVLKTCDFMVLPIRPYVDNKNGTLKAALQHGCIPIGKINCENKELEKLFVQMNNYSVLEFNKTYTKAVNLDERDLIREECIEYSKTYSIESICEKIISDIS